MTKGLIVGKEERTYPDKQTGEIKTSRTLHILCDAPKRPEDGFTGQKVITESVRFPIDDIKVGDYVYLDYDIRSTRSGTFASLVEITPVGKVDMTALAALIEKAKK